VWQPERLDFAAAPVLGDGLERRAPAPLIIPGAPVLLTAGLEPELSMAEWRRTSELLNDAKKKARPEAEKKRKAFIKERLNAKKKGSGRSSKHEKRALTEAVTDRALMADFPELCSSRHQLNIVGVR